MYDLRKSEVLETSEDISYEIHFLYVQVYIQYLVSLIYCKLLSPSMWPTYTHPGGSWCMWGRFCCIPLRGSSSAFRARPPPPPPPPCMAPNIVMSCTRHSHSIYSHWCVYSIVVIGSPGHTSPKGLGVLLRVRANNLFSDCLDSLSLSLSLTLSQLSLWLNAKSQAA